MKYLLLSFAVLCTIACAVQASRGWPNGGWPPRSTGPIVPRQPLFKHRFRREADPQGSIQMSGSQPLNGPDKRPSLDLNYNQRLIDNGRTTLDAYSGAHLHGNRVTPQAGFGVEHRFKNDMFISGQGQVQPGPRGGISPSFGANFGWRFRRDAEPLEEEEEEDVYEQTY